MVNSIARITLDIQDLSTSVTVSAKHGDTGRKIVIALSDGGFLYEVGPDCYAVLTAEKPDGSILFNHCDIEGNCIVYAFTEQTTAVVGVFPCEVKLYGADDALITTARFRIIVDGTVYNDGRVESKDEISALTHLISQVSEAKENAEQAAEDGAAAVQSSLLALENADEAIRTANTAANNANLAAEEANKYLPVATEALQTAGAAVQTANEAKQGVNTLREVVSKFHSNIVETSSGEVIQLSDASDLELVGLKVYGKTTQNGTPTPDAPVALESVGESVTVTVCGKNLFCLNDKMVPSTKNEVGYELNGNAVRVYTTVAGIRAGIRMSEKIRLQQGVTYRFSAMVNGIVSGTPGLAIRNADTYVYIKRDAVSSAGVLSFTYTPDEDVNAWLYVLCTSGDSEDGDVTFSDIQFEIGSAVTEYEPYKDGGSATVTPVDSSGKSLYLHGIPVTDTNGQQWICDEVDLEQRVYVQRVGVLVLNGTQGRYSDSQGVFILDGLENAAPKPYEENFSLCSHYAYGSYPNISMPDMTFKVSFTGGFVNLYIKDSRYTTAQGFKSAFAASPVTVLYQLENAVQHGLSDEALAQYAALRTNYPNTTVFNDAGAHMEVRYIADTQKYVDKKFEALEAAIASLI